ncbi:MAG TPA: outer membrane protein transport protein, partial [Burkholderiales bacterium]|nr:outer membrane protein transport protein [Burkholderiales bacterium]
MGSLSLTGSLFACLLAAVSSASAAGLAADQSASGLGRAFAGQSAVAEDASTAYYNPAGMTRLHGRQLVLVLSITRT